MNKQQQTILLHVIIAFLCLPIHYYMGEVFKLALLPYVLYLLFSKNPNYLPALIIHAVPGNTVSLVLLFSCIWISMANYKKLKKYRVTLIFKALIILLPVFLFFFYEGIFLKKYGISLSLQYLSFFLSFFGFFYGILLANKVNKNHWRAIILIIFLMPLIMYLPSPQKIIIRLFWLALPLAITILVANFLGAKLKVRKNLKTWSALFVLLIGIPYGLKFTPIFSAIIAISILLFYIKDYKLFFNMLTKPRIGVIVIILMILAIYSIDDFTMRQNFNVADYKINDLNSFMAYLKFKTFDDRAILWKGGWDFLVNSLHYWPTGEVPSYSYISAKGGKIDEIEFGMHNIGLEMMRNYGIIIGAYLTCVYMIIITKLHIVFKNVTSSFLLILSATLLGLGIAEGIVGQAVLMPMFSFTFLGLTGICYGIAESNRT
ncbi:hypothetical protein LX95_00106 [Mesonia algae]|uniref:O-antigen ligase-like membrane protein n=1 Tax=Mesonia algae TaxID=213248 RepID=A0A2W7IDT2_9FLAO|nr:hypothetical protein [Mesonia algae]PZW43782.1 hypothetical protein LX95_00106 [Mesonia algae]